MQLSSPSLSCFFPSAKKDSDLQIQLTTKVSCNQS